MFDCQAVGLRLCQNRRTFTQQALPWLPDLAARALGEAAPAPIDADTHLGTLVSQNALRRVLWEGCAALPGVRVLAGHRLESMQRDDDGVTVRLVFQVGEPPKATPRENLQNLLKFGSQFDNIEIK